MSGQQKILILKHRAMGDAIIGLSGVQYIRNLYPDAYIIYGVPLWTAPLFSNVLTAADEILPISLSRPQDWLNLWQFLIDLKIDLVYEMFQSGRTGKFFGLFSQVTGKPYLFHNHHSDARKNPKILDQGSIKPIIQRDLDGIFYQMTSSANAIKPHHFDYEPKMKMKLHLTEKQSSNTDQKKVIFGVVATRDTKKLPLNTYINLAQEIERIDRNIKILVPLSSSREDKGIGDQLLRLKQSQNFELIFEKLANLPAVLQNSKLYVGNDTGLKHLAVALGVKTLTFFGPEPPLEWHPYNQMRHPFFYRPDLECRTREAHYCGLKTCDSMICLNQFNSDDILEKIRGDLR
jgi:heptosyltransferase-2